MRLLTLAASAFCAFSLPAFAEDLNSDTFLGRDVDEVKFSLKEMGYKVLEIHANDEKIGDAPIEAKISKDGKTGEIQVNADSGKPTKIEME